MYFFDSEQKGLRLAVTLAGWKSYQFQVWSSVKQKPVSKTLGKVTDISIREARKRAAELLMEVSAGKDPEKKQQQQRTEQKLSDVFIKYIDGHAQAYKKTWKQDVKNYDRYFKKTLGGHRIR